MSPGGKFPDPARQVGERHVNGTGQVSRTGGKFLVLTHIDQNNGLSGGEAALQF
jgi:hypothetical protein